MVFEALKPADIVVGYRRLPMLSKHHNRTAIKVNDMQVPPLTIIAPKKGKVVNRKQLQAQLKSVMKNRGKEGPLEMRLFML